MQDGLSAVGRVAFKILRISFGIILLLSLVIVVVIVLVVIARGHGGNGDRRGGHGNIPVDAFRLVHRPRRHYVGGPDFRDVYWLWWWWNQVKVQCTKTMTLISYLISKSLLELFITIIITHKNQSTESFLLRPGPTSRATTLGGKPGTPSTVVCAVGRRRP